MSLLVGPGRLDSDNVSIGIVSTELAGLAEPVVFDSGDEGSVVVVGPVNVIPRGVGLDTGSPDDSVDLVVHVSQGEVGRLIKGKDVQGILHEVLGLKDVFPSVLDIKGAIGSVAVMHIVLQVRNIVDILGQFSVLEILKELGRVEEIVATLFVTGNTRERFEGEVSAGVGY